MKRTRWRAFQKVLGGLHRTVYRASGGKIGGKIAGVDVVLLTTTGRKSGRRRTTPLLAFREGDGFVVIASNGGQTWPPAWWLNLEASPEATVELGRDRIAVRARVLEGGDRERLWQRAVAGYAGYAGYAAKAGRTIPVVLLEPAAGS